MPSLSMRNWRNYSTPVPAFFLLLSVLGFGILFWVIFKFFGIEITLFRAESGEYLINSNASPADQQQFISQRMLSPYNGHFTPVAFFLEFLQTKLFQVNSNLWFLRQIFVLSMLATVVTYLASSVSKVAGSSARCSAIFGISLALFYIAQPIYLDLVAWPFMVFQILSLAVMGASCFFMVKFCVQKQTSDFAKFLFFAYATMHIFGVGLAMSVAALCTGLLMLLALRLGPETDTRHSRSRWLVFFTALLFTTVHASIMTSTDDASSIYMHPVSTIHTANRFGALFEGTFGFSLKSLWANGGYVWPRLDLVAAQGIYGLTLFLVLLIVVTSIGVRYIRQRDPADFVSFALSCISLFSLAAYVALIIFRLRYEPDDGVLISYLIGGRYLVFPTFFLVIMALAFSLQLKHRFGYWFAIASVTVAIASLVGTFNFSRGLLQQLWPHLTVNHEQAWNAIVDNAKIRIEEGKAVENTNLKGLGVEFPLDVKGLRFLLNRQLGCTDCVKFADP